MFKCITCSRKYLHLLETKRRRGEDRVQVLAPQTKLLKITLITTPMNVRVDTEIDTVPDPDPDPIELVLPKPI